MIFRKLEKGRIKKTGNSYYNGVVNKKCLKHLQKTLTKPQAKIKSRFKKGGLVCIPSSRQLKKYKIFVLPGWISGNIFMPPIVAFHEIPLVLILMVLIVCEKMNPEAGTALIHSIF